MFDNDDYIIDPNIPTRPKWASNPIHAAGELARNPNDTRRTRFQFESTLCAKDPLFDEKCYLMIYSDPWTYEDVAHEIKIQLASEEQHMGTG